MHTKVERRRSKAEGGLSAKSFKSSAFSKGGAGGRSGLCSEFQISNFRFQMELMQAVDLPGCVGGMLTQVIDLPRFLTGGGAGKAFCRWKSLACRVLSGNKKLFLNRRTSGGMKMQKDPKRNQKHFCKSLVFWIFLV